MSGAVSGGSQPRVTKQIVRDLLDRLPDDVSLDEVAKEIQFISAVREGLSELDRDDSVPLEEVEREIPEWIIK